MDDIVTFKTRGSTIVESYDLSALPVSLHRSLAIVGAHTLLTRAKDRPALHAAMLRGSMPERRGVKLSTWTQAAINMKAAALKKAGSDHPERDAAAWWGSMSAKDRAKTRRVHEVIVEQARITGRSLPTL